MVIEKATVEDITELCYLLGILFSQEIEFKADANAQKRGLRAIVTNPDVGVILVARHNDSLVGMVNILFTVSTALGGRVAILEDMIVLPSKRGSGVGSQLLKAAIVTARKNNCQRLTLLTDSDNEIAHRFYEKHGFTRSPMLPFRFVLS
ncbi:MAG: GNAT family N-acetyltransferase [Methylococcales bacterium]